MSYIIDAVRTPIAKMNSFYKNTIPEHLAAFLIQKLLSRNKISKELIDEVIISTANGTGGNMARYAALLAGLNLETPALSIDNQCSGGLKAIALADKLVGHEYIIAGGMESASLAPLRSYSVNDPRNKGENSFYKIANFSPEQFNENALNEAALNVAVKHNINKNELFEVSIQSHKNASQSKNILEKHIEKLNKKDFDNGIKPNINLALLQKSSTETFIDRTNSAHPADAASLVLFSKNKKNALAEILASVSIGNEPHLAPEGIIDASLKVISESKIKLEKIAAFEIGESYAVNTFIFSRYFNIPFSKINKAGGTLAYGHPYGASGTINLIHLLAILKKGELGLVTCPGAGGLATAMIIKKL